MKTRAENIDMRGALVLNVRARENNETGLGMKKKNRAFTHFISIARRLHAVCMNFCTDYPKTLRVLIF